jgi:hypothetical protein
VLEQLYRLHDSKLSNDVRDIVDTAIGEARLKAHESRKFALQSRFMNSAVAMDTTEDLAAEAPVVALK